MIGSDTINGTDHEFSEIDSINLHPAGNLGQLALNVLSREMTLHPQKYRDQISPGQVYRGWTEKWSIEGW